MHAQLAYTTALWTMLFVAAVITPASALPVQVVVEQDALPKSKNRGLRTRGAREGRSVETLRRSRLWSRW